MVLQAPTCRAWPTTKPPVYCMASLRTGMRQTLTSWPTFTPSTHPMACWHWSPPTNRNSPLWRMTAMAACICSKTNTSRSSSPSTTSTPWTARSAFSCWLTVLSSTAHLHCQWACSPLKTATPFTSLPAARCMPTTWQRRPWASSAHSAVLSTAPPSPCQQHLAK